MMCIVKPVLRTGVILGVLTAVGVGGMMLVAGPARTAAVLDQVQASIVSKIDCSIDDPTAMRAQLRQLQEEYPERISAVRGDLAEVHEEIRQLEREKAIALRVVDITSGDLGVLEPEVAQASAAGVSLVRYEGRQLTVNQAATRLASIRNTQVAYSNRAADADDSLVLLRQQATQLEGFLMELEGERAQLDAQVTQLDREVDAIERNERLIELMEKQKARFDSYGGDRFAAGSLEALKAQLDTTRSRQQAEIEYLSSNQERVDYEDLARMQLEAEAQGALPTTNASQVNTLVPVR